MVCSQLGYLEAKSTSGPNFGQARAKFAMDKVSCEGTETMLQDCLHKENAVCTLGGAASVVCTSNCNF